MKRLSYSLILLAFCAPFFTTAQTHWSQAPLQLPTRWSKLVTPENALVEYPRPQMVRSNWTNLNGLWEYAITPKDAGTPGHFDGQILVPYPVESALSGVKKTLLPSQNFWYTRTFAIKNKTDKKIILLHFGAVDWRATVFVNRKKIGEHQGGYTAFSFDITDAVHEGSNEIVVQVYDPTDEGIGPHGKQVLHPQNIYYTPTSGIWQTVWLESVPTNYISDIKLTPDIDKGVLNILVTAPTGFQIEANGTKGEAGKVFQMQVSDMHLWSPADPYLYDLNIKLIKDGATVDEVKSYFGMRKISVAKDDKGVDRIFLNNKPYYNLGVLDQGFWPDGLYTAPTDEALAFDIKAIKAMGFNTIRKHIKVEPARWYYWADKLGMLVWQDMVNPNQGLPEGSKEEFEKQNSEILSQLHNSPAIETWVLFNEKCGQYYQQRLT